MIRDRSVSAVEVVDAHLARIEAVNADVNAVVEVRPEAVRAEARAADAALAAGADPGPLHGVPFTVKTNIDVAGYATTQGAVALRDVMATRDAPTVEKMRAAGAVMLARTNMPDLGLRVNTESSLYGATHNPWRRGLTAGGSSGGEAAAIATGMSPLGLGNDLGGSLRNPAYACGIASIKPSRHRVGHHNLSAVADPGLHDQLMTVQGVLARTVADVREGLDVVKGSHRHDPHAVDAPLEGPEVARRVALVPEPLGGETHPDVAAAVRAAGRALADAGYDVDEVEPPQLFEAYLAWTELVVSGLSVEAPLLQLVLGEGGQRFLELTTVDFPPPTGETQYQMHQARYGIARAWSDFLTDHPLVVGPTWTQPPFALGYDVIDADTAMKVVETFRFVLPANLLGLPAACVPTGVAQGLPTGVQVIGATFREDTCLAAAQAVEDAFGVLTPIDPRG
ncbi:MAG: indole acetimide hydrolase [Acidobacteriota bacterium]|nr:indole acetimide hydrolase [Acidobacteriota bacterium]